jgi:hypothetical protein
MDTQINVTSVIKEIRPIAAAVQLTQIFPNIFTTNPLLKLIYKSSTKIN